MLTLVGEPPPHPLGRGPRQLFPVGLCVSSGNAEPPSGGLTSLALIPSEASVAADTPLVPLLAEREAVIRFPRHVHYRDRQRRVQPVDWVVAIPYHHTPLAPVFKGSRYRQQFIQRKLRNLKASGDYRLVHCHGGAVVLQRQVPDTAPGPMASSGSSSPCPWLE